MGYRNYIGFVSKEVASEIRQMPLEEVDKINIHKLPTELHEFGKHCNFHAKDILHPAFDSKEVHDYFNEEYEFFFVEKDFLRHVIGEYRKKIVLYYEFLLDGPKEQDEIEQTHFKKLLNHTRDMASQWTHLDCFDLDNGPEITTSWKYEYIIFELVRIYKAFDWENNQMIYYGN